MTFHRFERTVNCQKRRLGESIQRWNAFKSDEIDLSEVAKVDRLSQMKVNETINNDYSDQSKRDIYTSLIQN